MPTNKRVRSPSGRPLPATTKHFCLMCRSEYEVAWYTFRCEEGARCSSPVYKRTNQLMTGDHWHGAWLCARCRQGELGGTAAYVLSARVR